MGDLALSFTGGLLTGLVSASVFWLFRPRRLMLMAPGASLPAPAVLSTTCANGVLTVNCNIGAAPAGLKLCGVYVAVYDNQPTAVPSDPTGVAGVARFNPGAALNYTLPAGLNGPTDWVVVWAEYCGTAPSAAFSYNTCAAAVPVPVPVPPPPPPPS